MPLHTITPLGWRLVSRKTDPCRTRCAMARVTLGDRVPVHGHQGNTVRDLDECGRQSLRETDRVCPKQCEIDRAGLEIGQKGGVALLVGTADKGASSDLAADEPAFTNDLVSPSHGSDRDVELLGEIALGRKLRAGAERTAIDRLADRPRQRQIARPSICEMSGTHIPRLPNSLCRVAQGRAVSRLLCPLPRAFMKGRRRAARLRPSTLYSKHTA